MKYDSLLMAGLAFATGMGVKAQSKEKPNIIFILTDDMGIGDLSIYGGQVIKTPYLDKMADEGIKFTQYYCASPISSPSRAGLLTGKHPANWHITSYLQTKKGNRAAEMVDYLTIDAPTLPRTLKNNGYKTAHFGKWHLGGGRDVDNAPSITEYGYDEYASTYESPDPDPLLTASDWIWSKEDSIKRWNRTAYFVDKTLDFLRKNKGQPCFVNLWPDDVHTPWIGDYEQMEMSPKGVNSDKNFKTVMREYDYQIGRLLKELEKEGLDKNTIVVFTSDNGPAPSFEQIRTNGLRGQKASLFEGGIRMPFIIWGPKASIPQGKFDDYSVISAMDMFSTICSLTNTPLPDNFDTDGEDMSDALSGKPQKRKKIIYWEYRRNDDQAFPKPQGVNLSPNIALRYDDWKLLVNKDGSDVMLFNLKSDVRETKNLKNQYPQIMKMLEVAAMKWRNSLPENKSND